MVECLSHSFHNSLVAKLGTKTQIELNVELTWDNIGRTRTRLHVRDLEAGWREVFIPLVPLSGRQSVDCQKRFVHWVVRKMRVSHMALSPFDGQVASDRTTTTIFYYITNDFGA
ncbi:hypothetical protein VVATL9824_03950 [Vibrio vulnificus]|nr:hypothetical protein VVATL9824_03950 [Vibrio vulnificus]